ncbi:MAG: prolipoprotein diacylglyceryl transferase [Clostridia bacterium]|nr:prolipoprotein diacylglyceryl transferase [Clostridia bacterium]
MLDNHYTPDNFGIIRNFNMLGIEISTYTFFVALACFVTIAFYLLSMRKKEKEDKQHTFSIVMAALIGGIIGSKIPVIIENFEVLIREPQNLKYFLLTGKSIIGGIIGGWLAIKIIKKIKGISNKKYGNEIAPAIALGMGIGRIGCFLTGCCYGIETKLPIGVDFGDGALRYPTQLIEMIFCMILFIYLYYKQKTKKELFPGSLFKELVLYYFIFRFFIEFIRGTEKNIAYLSIYQVICLLGITLYIFKIIRRNYYGRRKEK